MSEIQLRQAYLDVARVKSGAALQKPPRCGSIESTSCFSLTPCELEVLEQLALGNRYQGTSDQLGTSLAGIRFHIRGGYNKRHVHSRTEAVVKHLKR